MEVIVSFKDGREPIVLESVDSIQSYYGIIEVEKDGDPGVIFKKCDIASIHVDFLVPSMDMIKQAKNEVK